MTEALPRLDWLLLLADDRPERFGACLVVGGGADLVKALEVIAGAAAIDQRLDPQRSYDLIVLIHPTEAKAVREAARRLAPGGISYVQTRRSTGLGARAVAKLLAGAGIDLRGQWAMLPDTARPRRYLPVDAPGAWHWYLNTVFIPTSLGARVFCRLLGAVARRPRLLTRVAPGIATLGKRPSTARSRVSTSPVDADRMVLITSGYDSGSRAVVLPFAAGERWPHEVTKIARREEVRDATRLEHTRLLQLHAELPAELVAALPVPRGLIETCRSTATRQDAARGPLMLVAAAAWPRHPDAAGNDLTEVAGWLAGLHLATAKPLPDGTSGQLWLTAPLARLRAVTDVPESVVELVRNAALALDESGPHPAVIQHYDVGPWNIVKGSTTFTLLDWELDQQAGRTGWGPPIVDFIYFANAWYSLATGRLDRTQELQGLLEAFDRGGIGWQGRLFADQLQSYIELVGLPPSAVRPLVVACWLERAVTAASRWERLREGVPDLKGLEYLAALADAGFLDKHTRRVDARW